MKIKIEVDTGTDGDSWIKDVALNIDIFRPEYCGYWARGIAYDTLRGWLVCVDDESDDANGDLLDSVALNAWRGGGDLPRGFYRFDHALAVRALAEGVRRHGDRFPVNYDGDSADVAVQRALFGEVRYA